jgi:TetR/AcrR family transcriptional regulator
MTQVMNTHSIRKNEIPVGLNRKEREFLRRRSEILDAAESAFAEKGFLSATMEEIAQQAEFSVGMLYRFFANKADLYLAAVENRIPELESEVHRCLDDTSAGNRQRLERYYDCRLEQYWANPRFFRLMLQGTITLVADPRTGFLPELNRRYERLVTRIESLFGAGIAAGEFRQGNPRLMGLSLEGLIRAYMIHLIHCHVGDRSTDDERELRQLFFEGIAR